MGLTVLQQSIVCVNISLRDKIHILKTFVDLSAIYPTDVRQGFKNMLQAIANYSPTRNMMAHDMFRPTDDGTGVKFIVVKAKGTLNIPDISWSVADFISAVEKIVGFSTSLSDLEKRLDRAKIVRALASAPAVHPAYLPPNSGINALGLLGGLFHQLPTDPQSDTIPATEQTAGETLPENEG